MDSSKPSSPAPQKATEEVEAIEAFAPVELEGAAPDAGTVGTLFTEHDDSVYCVALSSKLLCVSGECGGALCLRGDVESTE